MTKCFFDNTKLVTENISLCCFCATQGLNLRRLLIVWTLVKINNHIFSYQGRLYTSLHFTNQVLHANIYVLSLVYLSLF